MRKALSLVAILAVATAGTLGLRARAADAVAVGANAPNFTLPSQEDKPVSLSDYKGKWVVLYFYPKDQTTGCTIEAHNFQRDQAKYDALKAVVLGVSLDTVEKTPSASSSSPTPTTRSSMPTAFPSRVWAPSSSPAARPTSSRPPARS